MNLVAVVPAHNEVDTIGRTLTILSKFQKKKMISHIVVVNDGSTDMTSTIANQFPAVEVISHGVNKGKTAAFVTGAHYAHGLKADALMVVDADTFHFPQKTMKAILHALEKGAGMVVPAAYEQGAWRTFKNNERPKGAFVVDNKKLYQNYSRIVDLDYSGPRALSLAVLNPLFVGKRKWAEYFSARNHYGEHNRWGLEWILQRVIPKGKIVTIQEPIFHRAAQVHNHSREFPQAFERASLKEIARARSKKARDFVLLRKEIAYRKAQALVQKKRNALHV